VNGESCVLCCLTLSKVVHGVEFGFRLALVKFGVLTSGRVSVGFVLAEILSTDAVEVEYRVETRVNVREQQAPL